MKYIRLLLISFFVLFVFITIISLFIPSHIKLSKALNVGADKSEIMLQISEPLNWKAWYPGLDSAEILYKDGKAIGWTFNRKGKADIEIIKKTPDEIQAAFKGENMRPVINGWKVVTYSQTDSVTVQWYMDFHLRWYPWEKFASLLLEKSYGPQMEQGLTNLKVLAGD